MTTIFAQAVATMWQPIDNGGLSFLDSIPVDDNNQIPVDDHNNEPID